MALVSRRYLKREFDLAIGQDSVDVSLSILDNQPNYIDVQIDDQAYAGVLDALDQFMAQQGLDGTPASPASVVAPRHLVARIVDATVNLDPQDEMVIIDPGTAASIALTLPAANTVPVGKVYAITDIGGILTGALTCTITANGTDTINGAASQLLNVANQGRMLCSDGVSAWGIVGAYL
jgi:hypothetical protein